MVAISGFTRFKVQFSGQLGLGFIIRVLGFGVWRTCSGLVGIKGNQALGFRSSEFVQAWGSWGLGFLWRLHGLEFRVEVSVLLFFGIIGQCGLCEGLSSGSSDRWEPDFRGLIYSSGIWRGLGQLRFRAQDLFRAYGLWEVGLFRFRRLGFII